MIKTVLVIVVVACAACSYKSSFGACEVGCTVSTGCPPGFACSATSPGEEGLCGATPASCAVFDGGIDGDIDDDGPTDPCAGVSIPAACAGATPFVCEGTCHVYCTTPSNWDMAKAACEGSPGWSLTEINSLAEDTCVDGQIPDGTNTWIGLRQADGQSAVDTNWTWRHTGTAIPPTGTAFRRWESDAGTGSAPNDAGGASGEDGSQQCASTSGDNSGWDDRECPQTISYVCERFP